MHHRVMQKAVPFNHCFLLAIASLEGAIQNFILLHAQILRFFEICMLKTCHRKKKKNFELEILHTSIAIEYSREYCKRETKT